MILIIIGIKLAAEFINSQSKQLGEVDPLRLALQSKAHRDVIHVIDENGITIGLKKNPFYSSSNGSSNNVDNNSNGGGGGSVDGIGGTRGSSSGVVIDLDSNDLDGSIKDNVLITKTVRIDRDVDDDHGDDIDDLMAIDDDGGFISSESMSSSSDKMNNNDKISNYKNKGARDSNNRSKSQVRGKDGGVVRRGGGGKVETTVAVDFDSNGSSDAASDVDLISSHSNDSPSPPFSPLMSRDLELSLSSVPLSLLPIVPTLSIPPSTSSSSIPMTKNPMLNNKAITSILSMRDHYNNDDDIIDGFYDRDNNHNSNDEVQREKNLFKSHYQHDVENLQLLMSQMTNQSSSSSSLHHKNINPIRWIKDKASSALERKQQHHHQQHQHQDNTKTQRRKSFSGGDIGQYDDDYDGGGSSSSSSGIGAKGNTKISSDSSGNRATRNKYTTRATTIINPDRTVVISTDTVIGREKTNGGGVDMDIKNITIPAAKGSVRSNSTVNNQL